MASPARPPVLLYNDDPPATGHDLPVGWRVRRGFALPDTPWDLSARRWVCVGVIAAADDAEAAIAALSRGVGLAVGVRAGGDLCHRTLEDLYRLGDVVVTPASSPQPASFLDEEQRLLIEALARGETVTEAARGLHLSRRTANRRLAEIRTLLGVQSNAEAMASWSSRP